MQPQVVWRGSIPVVERPAPQSSDTPVVLVVTNDGDLREVSARVLGREGYMALTAAHAGHALLACLKAGHIDVLVAELSMDDVSGPALAARLQRHNPEMATVYVASAGTPECEGVLVRPFTRDDLLTAVAVRLAASAVTA